MEQSRRMLLLRSVLFLCICQQFVVDVHGQHQRLEQYEQRARTSEVAYERLAWSSAHIGHRLTGSEQGRKAERFVDSLFRADGLDTVYTHDFTANAWSRGAVGLTVKDADGFRHMACVALANTPLESIVEGVLVDAGNGLPGDLEKLGDRAKGTVLVVNIGLVAGEEGSTNLHRSEKASLAMKAGATAIVFVNQVEGGVLLTGTASIDGELIGVPAVCVATEDGHWLRERLLKGVPLTARLTMKNQSERVSARNIIAELRGTELPNEVIIVGGHLDSWDLATGATDNGLGSFSISDMARVLASMPFRPRRTFRFVLFMGEEQGLLGSRSLVAHYQKEGTIGDIRCMVNLDMSGNPQGFGVAGPAGWLSLLEGACERISMLDTAAFQGRSSNEVWLHSDHQPFLMAGVPVIYPLSDLGSHVYGCYHSSCDDIHLVKAGDMTNNVRFVGALLLDLDLQEELPSHFTTPELRTTLQEAGLENSLRIANDWPWTEGVSEP